MQESNTNLEPIIWFSIIPFLIFHFWFWVIREEKSVVKEYLVFTFIFSLPLLNWVALLTLFGVEYGDKLIEKTEKILKKEI